MEWLQIIVTAVVTIVTTLGGSVLYFRPKLKEANANAIKAQADAQNYVYESLVNRINTMEKMHNEQYAAQNKVIENLREEVLKLTEEKFVSDKRIIQLEGENSALRERVDGLEKEVQAYKTIAAHK